MAYQGIGTGTTPNDNSGDSLLTGAVKINSNFTEIYNTLGNGSVLGNASLTSLSVNSVNIGGVTISAGIITATSGVTTYYGDGTYLTFGSGSFDERAQDAVGAAINAGTQTGIAVTYNDASNRIDFSNYNITTTSSNKTLTNLEYCTVTANNLTITLPSSPSDGSKVMIGISGDFNNTTIGRNGSNIMGLAENMTIDSGYVTLSMIYINSTLGWRIS
jgi:hypothetical protein